MMFSKNFLFFLLQEINLCPEKIQLYACEEINEICKFVLSATMYMSATGKGQRK
jgi:hypothetical protein